MALIKKKTKKKSTNQKKMDEKQKGNIILGVKIAILLISLFAIINQGVIGDFSSSIYDNTLGSLYIMYASVVMLVIIYTFIFKKRFYKSKPLNIIIGLTIVFWTITSSYYVLDENGSMTAMLHSSNVNGGILGTALLGLVQYLIGSFGVILFNIILIILLIIYVLVDSRETINDKVSETRNSIIKKTSEFSLQRKNQQEMKIKTTPPKENNIEIKKDIETDTSKTSDFRIIKDNNVANTIELNRSLLKIQNEKKLEKNEDYPTIQIHKEEKKTISPTIKKAILQTSNSYITPSLEHLNSKQSDVGVDAELEKVAKEKSEVLQRTLEHFKIDAKITDIHIGPNITKYEVVPSPGVKLSKFSGLSNDIAMSLAAKSIRIEAPIPGKAAVGIEVPNVMTKEVILKDTLIENDVTKLLQVPLGKDISGKTQFMEINKAPHMLVAGATGSGKSVFINSMIISLLYKTSPEDLKLIMIDPKKVELAPYNGIPHLLTPVVSDPKKAAVILKKMVAEMESRYEMFVKTQTRNIEGFNDKIGYNNPMNYSKLPYIVIVIDELADLMMVASNDVETSIARLAQMARAAGIHLVVATQRPSTDVITGLIKSNIPTRISFGVSSGIDSRTILDSNGAERLLGKGDMLYKKNGSEELLRIQGAYLSDIEINNVIWDVIENNSVDVEKEFVEFEQELEQIMNVTDVDDLYEDAKRTVVIYQRASISLLQRELKIGFNRATKIMNQLEENKVISEARGTKPREVLLDKNDL